MPWNYIVGLVCVFGGAAYIYRKEVRRKGAVGQLNMAVPALVARPAGGSEPVPLAALSAGGPRFQCWACHSMNPVPKTVPNGLHITHCMECGSDNEVDVHPLDQGEVLLGHMVTVNRVKSFHSHP